MRLDNQYSNTEEVRKMVADCPVMNDYENLSEEVKQLLLDVHDYLDAAVGYAERYLEMSDLPRIKDEALLGHDFWDKYKEVSRRSITPQDIAAINRIEAVAHYCTQLKLLFFENSKMAKHKRVKGF